MTVRIDRVAIGLFVVLTTLAAVLGAVARGGNGISSGKCEIEEYQSYTQIRLAEERLYAGVRARLRIPANCNIMLDGSEWIWSPLSFQEIQELRHPTKPSKATPPAPPVEVEVVAPVTTAR